MLALVAVVAIIPALLLAGRFSGDRFPAQDEVQAGHVTDRVDAAAFQEPAGEHGRPSAAAG